MLKKKTSVQTVHLLSSKISLNQHLFRIKEELTMKKTILLIIAIACFSNIAFTQSQKAYKKKADEALAAKNYSAAFSQYHFLVNEAGRSNVENNFGAAESARQAKVYYLAETYYRKVVADEDGTKAHPLSEFWLADVLKRQGKYLESRNRFQSFLDNGGSANAEYADRAGKEMNDCDFAMNEKPLFDEERIEHLDEPINSVVLDFAPVKSGDVLYFSSMREDYEYSKNNESGSEWVRQVDDWRGKGAKSGFTQIYTKNEKSGKVELFNEFNEGNLHTAHVAFAKNNARIYYTLCENVNATDINCKIYYRNLEGKNKWGKKIDAGINVKDYTTTQPNVGRVGDKDVLFFASDRTGSKGGLDIWCSFIEDDACSTPVNLSEQFGGNDLNTSKDDMSPFWDEKSQTLYFSSEGHKNMGSHDIYKVKFNEGSCGTIEHLGAPINSSYDDTYYTLSDDRKHAYFTSNRPGGLCGSSSDDSLCICYDIYKMATPRVKLEVYTFNAITKEPIYGANVKLANLSNLIEDDKTDDAGNFYEWYDSPLGFDFEYGVVGTKPEYKADVGDFSTAFEVRKDTVIRVDLYLMPSVDLTTYVYDKITGLPLEGATVELHEVENKRSIKKVNVHPKMPTENDQSDYFDSLNFKKTYMVLGRKPPYYSSDTSYVTVEGTDLTTVGLSTPTNLKAELRLCKDLEVIPFSVYFDNDFPDPDCENTTTDLTYAQTYFDYLKRRSYYVDAFSPSSQGYNEMNGFFENDVIGGYEKLERFAEDLYDYFKGYSGGRKASAIITIQGHASLRSNPRYNLALTKRRVSSLENYLANWSKGNKSLKDYSIKMEIQGGAFGDTEACIGCYEKPAIKDVKASRDRRVDIKRVQVFSDCEGTIEIKPNPVKTY